MLRSKRQENECRGACDPGGCDRTGKGGRQLAGPNRFPSVVCLRPALDPLESTWFLWKQMISDLIGPTKADAVTAGVRGLD